MASSCLVNIVTLLLLVLANAVSGGSFSPHEYGCSRFNHYLGPQQDWEADLAPAFNNGSFTVVIHGVAGSGKSALTKMLCGEHDSLVIGRKAPGNYVESKMYTCRPHTATPNSAPIYVIDTPGFGQSTQAGELQVLQGVDQAHQLALLKKIPLKRIYFLLNWTCGNLIPEKLADYLRLLLLRYGPSVASCVRFVVSRCDLKLNDGNMDKSQAEQQIQIVFSRFQEVFEVKLDFKALLFVALEPSNNARQLACDLSLASGDSIVCRLENSLCPSASLPWSHYRQMHEKLDLIIKAYKDLTERLDSEPNPSQLVTLHHSICSIKELAERVAQFLVNYETYYRNKADEERIGAACVTWIPIAGTVSGGTTMAFALAHFLWADEAKTHRLEIRSFNENLPDGLASHCR